MSITREFRRFANSAIQQGIRNRINKAVCELQYLTPEFAGEIYAEVKAEANTYSIQGEYERLERVIRLLSRGIEPKVVYETIREQKDDLLEMMTI